MFPTQTTLPNYSNMFPTTTSQASQTTGSMPWAESVDRMLRPKSTEQAARVFLAQTKTTSLAEAEKDSAFKEKLFRFVVERTRAIDEIEKHMQDMRNQADAAQEKLDLLQSTLRFLDQKYLESTNEQLQQLLTEYLRRLSDDERQT